MKQYVVDFDDYCDNVKKELYTLEQVKKTYPGFLVTLFAIPKRCSIDTIQAAKALDRKYGGGWLELAPHGWRHTRGECLSWTSEEAEAKIKKALEMGIDTPVFKAPGWLVDEEVEKACKNLQYKLFLHEYLNDIPDMVHGHLTNVMGNYIRTMLDDGRLTFESGSTFLRVKDAIDAHI